MKSEIKALTKALVPDAVLQPFLKRRFFANRSWTNRHWGVFDSFEAANRFAAQQGNPAKFTLDHRKWLDDHQSLVAHDYPMLFWLMQILGDRPARVADLGGSLGATYYAYQRVVTFPAGLQWQVCELPDVVELGRQIAEERGAAALSFSSDTKVLDGADVLFSAGAIQYIDTPFTETLAGLRAPPRHVLLNKLPLTARRSSFITLQHSGLSALPYRIANHAEFVKAMERLGYRQRDRWKCMENFTNIPLHPELTIPHFHGFYFERVAAETPRA